ncbi:MAG TPA: histidine kinase [Streptosporangiaceae bacterium]|nr:histidine kinase [Streptosporangiaceae bacterium]
MNVRTWARRHWLLLDVLIAVCFALGDTANTLGGGSWWPAHPSTLAWVMLGIQALADLSLAARRRAPLTVIAILGAFTVAISLLIEPGGALTAANSGNVWAPYGTVLAAYGPFYFRKNQRAAFAAVGTLTLVVARVWDPSTAVITLAVLRTALGPLLAVYFTARNAMVHALRDRADRAERESRLLAEQARADERARLAGEMHDVVTHRVSLMVLQAGALSVTATDEVTRRAAEELRTAGCQALEELRDLVGLLHAASDDDQPSDDERGHDQTDSASALAALVAESTAVGSPAELDEEGDPALASPVVGRTVYRIVREALTNVRKHAPGARVQVQISYGDRQVTVTVSNTPAPGPASPDLAATGSGLGIASLRRRIELVHGTLRAGPTPDDGYRLEAALPAYVPTAEPVRLSAWCG